MAKNYRDQRLRQRRAEINIGIIVLGCPKNIVDSEHMLGLFSQKGYRVVADAEDADLVVIHTCGFLDSARTEGSDVVEEMIERKKTDDLQAIVVTGCMVQFEGSGLSDRYPLVDRWIGVYGRDKIVDVADEILDVAGDRRKAIQKGRPYREPRQKVLDLTGPAHPLDDGNRLRITEQHLAYLKIAEGCDRRCSFCAIPDIRGRFASKTIESLVREAKELAEDGVRELILVAQETTYFGKDRSDHPELTELLTALNTVDGIDWIRILYAYPMYFDDALIKTIADCEKVLPYIDIPLQHASDDILDRMNRKANKAETESLLARLREGIPDLVLRSSMIVGFPGETEEQFEELVEFVEKWKFERLGVFEFSPEKGTAALDMPDQIDPEIIAARAERLIAVQRNIADQWNESQIGRVKNVILDRYIGTVEDAVTNEGDASPPAEAWIGRCEADAPEIDGAVYVTGHGLEAGDIVPCEIVAVDGYDLVGVAIAEAE